VDAAKLVLLVAAVAVGLVIGLIILGFIVFYVLPPIQQAMKIF
jgi:hypothetical protein